MMKLLICTSFNILQPSANKNRLDRMRRALLPHDIEAILVGAGDTGQLEPWKKLQSAPDGQCITYNPDRVRVFRHSRVLKFGALAALFYQDYLTELVEKFKCSGIIVYASQVQVFHTIIKAANLMGIFVVADLVEHFGLSWHYLLNGVNYQQFWNCKYLLSRMSGIIGISKAWCTWAEERGIPNVWIPSFAQDNDHVRTKSSIKDRSFTLTFIGHWVSRELPLVFLKAMRYCIEHKVNISMDVLGNVGKLYRERHAVRFLNKDPLLSQQVRFHGFVSNHERDQRLADSDAFVLLRSNNRETDMLFPTRLPEYLLTGNPVILSKVGSFPQCFEHRKDVWFVSAKNTPEEVGDALIYLAQHPTERLKIGSQGRQTALTEFSSEVLGKRLAKFLEQCALQN